MLINEFLFYSLIKKVIHVYTFFFVLVLPVQWRLIKYQIKIFVRLYLIPNCAAQSSLLNIIRKVVLKKIPWIILTK